MLLWFVLKGFRRGASLGLHSVGLWKYVAAWERLLCKFLPAPVASVPGILA